MANDPTNKVTFDTGLSIGSTDPGSGIGLKTNSRGSLEGTVIAAYMAQMPYYESPPDPPRVPKYVQAPPLGLPTQDTYYYHADSNDDTGTLLDAIFALQGQTAEIYKLKALAFTIKAKLNE
jgi:hypothetical protein